MVLMFVRDVIENLDSKGKIIYELSNNTIHYNQLLRKLELAFMFLKDNFIDIYADTSKINPDNFYGVYRFYQGDYRVHFFYEVIHKMIKEIRYEGTPSQFINDCPFLGSRHDVKINKKKYYCYTFKYEK